MMNTAEYRHLKTIYDRKQKKIADVRDAIQLSRDYLAQNNCVMADRSLSLAQGLIGGIAEDEAADASSWL